MYIQGVDSIYDIKWDSNINYGDAFLQNEIEQSSYNFDHSNPDFLLSSFNNYEKEAANLVGKKLSLPAYEQVLKAAHTFNLLDARGVIGVTERAEYIAKIRNISRDVAKAYLDSRMVLGFPLAERGNAEEVIKVMKNAEK